ncbi:MAG TPA: hypothetical protein VJT73_14220 [Polyangiaceae bacterium]|nr:hypothetical protein [Polyangiaceae bacterium]
MAKTNGAGRVLPHGPIEQLESNLWRVEGTLPNMSLKRVMTIARLSTGEIVVHNPITLDGGAMKELDALGSPAFVIIPNGWHRLDAGAFQARYPQARVFAPQGSRAKVARVVEVAGTFAEFPLDKSVSLTELDGTRAAEGVMFVRSDGRTTLVFTDAIFNMPHGHGFTGFLLRYITQSTGGPRVSRVAKLMLIKDKPAFAAHLERLATPDVHRIIVAHHQTITERPVEVLREVAASVR